MKRKSGEAGNVKIKKKKPTEVKKVLTQEEREKRKTSVYRAPTNEELTELKENEDLYKNNLFRMQIQYLLEEICLQEDKLSKINKVLHSFNTFLKGLPTQTTSHEISSGDCQPEGLEVPFPSQTSYKKIKGNFRFVAPSDVKVIGSFLLKTTIKADQSVDVAVEIPKELLCKDDYLNYRYYYKRSLYLAWLASHLKGWQHTEAVIYTCEHDMYKPVLKVTLKGKVGKKYSLTIHAIIPEGAFKRVRYIPLRNNVRSNWFDGIETRAVEEIEFPTPHYNHGILSDMLYEEHLRALYNALKECPGMKDAICLFKVWLKQRSLKGNLTFNGFCCSMLLVYLLSIRKISAHMSSYQIFRLALHFLATSNLETEGITLCKNDHDQRIPPLPDFHSVFDIVFVDPTGFMNLCANVDSLTYQMIRYQANLSLNMLDNSSVDAFHGLFIKSQTFLQSTDHSFQLNITESFKEKCMSTETLKASMMDRGGDWSKLLLRVVTPVLKRGLGERVKAIFSRPRDVTEWSVTEKIPDLTEKTSMFGLILNTDHSDNVLIMGPPADQPDAKEFRNFWGSKSELRRFQDGSINEAVLWSCNNMAEKSMVPKQIVTHLLNVHCGIPATSITYHGEEFNSILNVSTPSLEQDSNSKNKYVRGNGEEESSHVVRTFEELCREIRGLKDLPLIVNSIHGVDSALRFTQALTPRQYIVKGKGESDFKMLKPRVDHKCPVWCPSINALIQFEASGKWPDDLIAIQHIRAAFHIKIAECIRQQLHLPVVTSPLWFSIMKNGYVYRFSVIHYREMVLYKESTATGRLKQEHELAAKQLELNIVKKPHHNSLIHSLNGHYRGYALACRLAKRWISSHMLSNYFCEELIELLTASLFISPQPFEPPNCHATGFLRFLDLMANHDWNAQPLIVNLNDEIKREDIEKLTERFTNTRDHLPTMVVMTSYDKNGAMWTKPNPNAQIVRRVAMLAEAALNLVENERFDYNNNSIMQLFRPSTKDYDVVIELDQKFVPQHSLVTTTATSSALVKLTPSLNNDVKNNVLPVVNFDPSSYFLKELEDAFSDVAMFFHDKFGGLKIGVVWKKDLIAPQPFKILNIKYKKYEEVEPPSKKNKKKKKSEKVSSNIEEQKNLVPNLSAIINDFSVIGRGLVKKVEILKPLT